MGADCACSLPGDIANNIYGCYTFCYSKKILSTAAMICLHKRANGVVIGFFRDYFDNVTLHTFLVSF